MSLLLEQKSYYRRLKIIMSNSVIVYPFRKLVPRRTCDKVYNDYKRYKPYIVKDFNKRCAYTDCPDSFFGGARNFHIDHIKPKKKFPSLRNDYKNLVYSCSYVNIKKSDNEVELLDPCDIDWNLHFGRDCYGNILPLPSSEQAEAIYLSLSLYLKRYGIVWMLERLRELKKQIHELCTTQGGYATVDKDILMLLAELDNFYIQYETYLGIEL